MLFFAGIRSNTFDFDLADSDDFLSRVFDFFHAGGAQKFTETPRRHSGQARNQPGEQKSQHPNPRGDLHLTGFAGATPSPAVRKAVDLAAGRSVSYQVSQARGLDPREGLPRFFTGTAEA